MRDSMKPFWQVYLIVMALNAVFKGLDFYFHRTPLDGLLFFGFLASMGFGIFIYRKRA
jgi:hypothetical protein